MATEEKREIPTPENWHWAITPQQVTEIKQGNRDTINKVYFDNLPTFKQVMYNFCRKYGRLQFFDDCIQQVYLDLPRYCLDNASTFYKGLLSTFFAVGCVFDYPSIEVFNCLSVDSNIQGFDDLTIGDTIQAPPEVDEAEFDEQNKRAIDIIRTQTQLTDEQRDWLVAVAFGCMVQRGLYERVCLLYPV